MTPEKTAEILLRADAIRELHRIEHAYIPLTCMLPISNDPRRPKEGQRSIPMAVPGAPNDGVVVNQTGVRGTPTTLGEVAAYMMRHHLETALANYKAALRRLAEGDPL